MPECLARLRQRLAASEAEIAAHAAVLCDPASTLKALADAAWRAGNARIKRVELALRVKRREERIAQQRLPCIHVTRIYRTGNRGSFLTKDGAPVWRVWTDDDEIEARVVAPDRDGAVAAAAELFPGRKFLVRNYRYSNAAR